MRVAVARNEPVLPSPPVFPGESPAGCMHISGTLRPQDDFEVAQSDGVRDRSISTQIVIRWKIRRLWYQGSAHRVE
jgi:hypothetical protein